MHNYSAMARGRYNDRLQLFPYMNTVLSFDNLGDGGLGLVTFTSLNV